MYGDEFIYSVLLHVCWTTVLQLCTQLGTCAAATSGSCGEARGAVCWRLQGATCMLLRRNTPGMSGKTTLVLRGDDELGTHRLASSCGCFAWHAPAAVAAKVYAIEVCVGMKFVLRRSASGRPRVRHLAQLQLHCHSGATMVASHLAAVEVKCCFLYVLPLLVAPSPSLRTCNVAPFVAMFVACAW
ncbi:hypothetical protein COO60DRAFT_759675 [Scenedesmus sp. NREL 46B-D3]|nr:hypothetical protein COO60DRAFT_759675 [Scenedesmus sp. NREL 46B-D3]